MLAPHPGMFKRSPAAAGVSKATTRMGKRIRAAAVGEDGRHGDADCGSVWIWLELENLGASKGWSWTGAEPHRREQQGD